MATIDELIPEGPVADDDPVPAGDGWEANDAGIYLRPADDLKRVVKVTAAVESGSLAWKLTNHDTLQDAIDWINVCMEHGVWHMIVDPITGSESFVHVNFIEAIFDVCYEWVDIEHMKREKDANDAQRRYLAENPHNGSTERVLTAREQREFDRGRAAAARQRRRDTLLH